LVVEDDENLLVLFDEILSRAGYEVTTADSAFGAVALVRQRKPAAVLLDLGLPFRPGASLLGDLKADPATWDIPVVIVSGLTETLTEERRALAAAIVPKPVDAIMLLDAVASACSQRWSAED
jgi:CheY-like chemotaxis protein